MMSEGTIDNPTLTNVFGIHWQYCSFCIYIDGHCHIVDK